MQAALITRRDLSLHGAGSDFLGQFTVRPIEVTIETGGALGTATAKWRLLGDSDWSPAELSTAGASWTWEAPDPSWASLVFPAATYVAGDAWTVDAGGTVTTTSGARSITATRYDVVAEMILAGSSDFATWAQPRCVPPILSLGSGEKSWLAKIVVYRLKSRQGMTPSQAGSGDENLRLLAEDAERNIKAIGRSDNRPPDLVDSSPGGTGAGLPHMPRSRSLRGFGDFS